MIAASETTVNMNLRIRRERRLPQAGEITVSLGQQVTPVQVVARTSQQRGYTIVPAAEILGVRPEELNKYLLVEEGAAVQRKKPLLERRSLLGSKTVTSPVNGVLYQVTGGRLILQQTPDLLELRAMLHGMVSSFLANRGVVIETTGALIEARWASGREGYGTIKVLDTRDTVLGNEHIAANVRGMILVAGYLKHLGPLELAEENSVRGVIAGSVPARLIPELSGFRFPILITEGFGSMAMSTPVYNLLQRCDGREASLLGATNEEWRNPEIVIPIAEAEVSSSLPAKPTEPQIGQLVRIWREPHAGKIGRIASLARRSRLTEAGFRMSGVTVSLEDGTDVFVPYANLDMIR